MAQATPSKESLQSRDLLSQYLSGNIALAAKNAERLLKRGKKLPVAYFVLAYKSLQDRDKGQADSFFDKIKVAAIKDGYSAYQMATIDVDHDYFERAELLYKRAIKLEKSFWEALYNLGNLYQEQKHFAEARDQYLAAVKFQKKSADLYFNIGLSTEKIGLYAQARDAFEKSVEIEGDKGESLCGIARCYWRLGDEEKANEYWSIIQRNYPDEPALYVDKAAYLSAKDRETDANALLATALKSQCHHPRIFIMLGRGLKRLEKYDSALKFAQKATSLYPQNRDVWEFFCEILLDKKRFRDLITAEKELRTLGLSSLMIRHYTAIAFYSVGQLEEAAAIYKKLIEEAPRVKILASSYLGLLAYADFASAEEIYQEHKRVGLLLSSHAEPVEMLPVSLRDHTKLRVGIVSQDICNHAVMRHAIGLMMTYDRNQFEMHIFAQVVTRDHITEKVKDAVDDFIDISDLSDREVVKKIIDKEIDILVDLSGHTAHNRLGIFSWRSAPVQLSTIGSNMTTGLPEMDYFFSFNNAVAKAQEKFFTEKIRQLDCRLDNYVECAGYIDKSNFYVSSDPPSVEKGHVTFACYSRMSKIEEPMFDAWVEILNRIPGSVLRLKNTSFDDNIFMEETRQRFIAKGIDPKQLDFRSKTSLKNYLLSMQSVDLALVSYPFSGGTVANDFAVMGVPFVTRYSELVQSRDGYGTLKIFGLEDKLAVDHYDDYIEKAVHYAQDVEFLRSFRKMIRSVPRNFDIISKPMQKAFLECWEESKAPYLEKEKVAS